MNDEDDDDVVVHAGGIAAGVFLRHTLHYFRTCTLSVFCNPCCKLSGIASWILVLILQAGDVPEHSQWGIAIFTRVFHMIMTDPHGIGTTQKLQPQW